MTFLHDNFLLSSPTGERLYHEIAKDLPLVDFHNHLPPEAIAKDQVWDNLSDMWLGGAGGDHYKWRAMRSCGESETVITGDADPYDRFQAWARTVPQLLRSPLYTWTHLELRRVFGIDTLLSPDTARDIWDTANAQLPQLSARALLTRFNVVQAGTTDDPSDTLPHHQVCAKDYANGTLSTLTTPTFRPDKAHAVTQPQEWCDWATAMSTATGVNIDSLDSLLQALSVSYSHFNALGCRASDHGLLCIPDVAPNPTLAAQAIKDVLAGQTPSTEAHQALVIEVLTWCATQDHAHQHVMQLHLGPMRNISPRLMSKIGRDAGGDVMSDANQGAGLARFLGHLEQCGHLPRMVLYNLNPAHNVLFAAIAHSFHGTESRGHVQFGSGWWFLDQEKGMRDQIETLSQIGVLSTFVGMLTDSRSFLSFPRHELFRRILCDMIGRDADNGRIPNSADLLEPLVQNICVNNARTHFGFDFSV